MSLDDWHLRSTQCIDKHLVPTTLHILPYLSGPLLRSPIVRASQHAAFPLPFRLPYFSCHVRVPLRQFCGLGSFSYSQRQRSPLHRDSCGVTLQHNMPNNIVRIAACFMLHVSRQMLQAASQSSGIALWSVAVAVRSRCKAFVSVWCIELARCILLSCALWCRFAACDLVSGVETQDKPTDTCATHRTAACDPLAFSSILPHLHPLLAEPRLHAALHTYTSAKQHLLRLHARCKTHTCIHACMHAHPIVNRQ